MDIHVKRPSLFSPVCQIWQFACDIPIREPRLFF